MRHLALIFALIGCSAPGSKTGSDNDQNDPTINTPSTIVAIDDTAARTLPDDDKDSGVAVVDTGEAKPEELVFGFLETACGHSVGENACDVRLLDQADQPWRLSDHLGDVVLLDLSAMWCAPCQTAAGTAQATQDHYSAQGFHYVTILVVDTTNDTMELAEAQQWATEFGITTAPVLQGSRDLLQSSGTAHGYPVTSWPTFIVIDRSQTVASGLRGFSESYIRTMIEDAL